VPKRKLKVIVRTRWPIASLIAGGISIVGGVALLSIAAAMIVGGVLAILLGLLVDPEAAK